MGGRMLKIKDLQTFESKTVISLFNVCTQIPKNLILNDSKSILCAAQEVAKSYEFLDLDFDTWDLPRNSTIPALEIRLHVPKIPGQDASHYNKLEWRVQNNRKVYHIECDKKFSKNVKRLTQLAKEFKIVDDWWGKHAHVTEVVDKDATPGEIKRLSGTAQTHTNYQCSKVVEEIFGITDLNGSATISSSEAGTGSEPIGWMTLRQVLQKGICYSASTSAAGPTKPCARSCPTHPGGRTNDLDDE
jgi:hypothetical protein